MTDTPSIQPVLARYGADLQPREVQFLAGAGGFSGALFWKIHAPGGTYCLRRWPREHPTPGRLKAIHEVLLRARAHGFALAATPLATREAETFVQHAGHLWELAVWLPGQPVDARTCSDAQIAGALSVLGEFHRACRESPPRTPSAAPSPGVHRRLGELWELLNGKASRIAAAVRTGQLPELGSFSAAVVETFPRVAARIQRELQQFELLPVRLQPCIRDVWHDHVLFVGERVTGLIDFGAMQVESVAGDVARLLGSYAESDERRWGIGLAAYEAVFPLTENERLLVRLLDRSFVALAGMQWLEWLHVEGRSFENMAAVGARLAMLARRMRLLA